MDIWYLVVGNDSDAPIMKMSSIEIFISLKALFFILIFIGKHAFHLNDYSVKDSALWGDMDTVYGLITVKTSEQVTVSSPCKVLEFTGRVGERSLHLLSRNICFW